MDFKKQIEEMKAKALGLVTKDSPTEDINKVTAFNKDLDELVKEYEKQGTELTEVKDAYLKSMMKQGSTDKPEDPIETKKEKSLEELAQEIIQKRPKTKGDN